GEGDEDDEDPAPSLTRRSRIVVRIAQAAASTSAMARQRAAETASGGGEAMAPVDETGAGRRQGRPPTSPISAAAAFLIVLLGAPRGLAVERPPVDAEDPRGERLVSAARLEDLA